MVFGKHIDYDGEDYYCKLCSRWFYSWTALMGHCRNTTRHEWCETCKRVFRTAQELDQHKNASGNHHICDWCNYRPDFETALELENHRVKCHDMCRLCGETFQNENNLRMVSFYLLCIPPFPFFTSPWSEELLVFMANISTSYRSTYVAINPRTRSALAAT